MTNTDKQKLAARSKASRTGSSIARLKSNKSNAIVGLLKPVKSALPHLCLIMCLMLLVFFSIDRVNHHIGFMKNEFHKWLTLFLCLAVISESGMAISRNRRQIRKEEKRKNRNRQTTRMQNEPDQR